MTIKNMNYHLFRIAKILNEHEYQNVIDISKKLTISPSTVMDALKELESYRFPFQHSKSQGYRLAYAITWLSERSIRSKLGSIKEKYMIELIETTESTNTDLVLRSQSTDVELVPTVRVAELQTKGRGRRGRFWLSGLGSSLTFSVMRTLKLPPKEISGLSLAVGVSVITALEKLGGTEFYLKWPNDIIRKNKKIGGVLVEVGKITPLETSIIIGIGINVRGYHLIDDSISLSASDLYSGGINLDRNLILSSIIVELDQVLIQFSDHGFEALRESWQRRHYYENKLVQLILNNQKNLLGLVKGVTSRGALRIEKSGQIIEFTVGEISLREVNKN